MRAIDTPECNFTFGPPEGWEAGKCESLRVRVGTLPDGQPAIQSFWQPSEEDIASILAGQPIMLTILGRGMPPVCVEVAR